MSLCRISAFSITVLLLQLILSPVYADDKTSDPCEGSLDSERAPKGNIASFGSYGQTVSIDDDVSSAPGDSPSIISGSIQPFNQNKCKVVINNLSQCNSYSVSFVVKGVDSKGRSGSVTSGSPLISAKGSKEIQFSCDSKKSYRLEVLSAKGKKN